MTVIYVATHKPAPLPRGDFYIPIVLGGALIEGVELHDNSHTDNISHLNKYFCELTATYWMFKHSPHTQLGLCHYRRFFNFLPDIHPNLPAIVTTDISAALTILSHPKQKSIASEILEQYDIIVPRADYSKTTVGKDYVEAHREEEWSNFITELDALYGAQSHSMTIERRFFMANMLICNRTIFHQYASDLFQILANVFNKIGIPPCVKGKRYQDYRYPGYLGERFTAAFINRYKLKYFEAQTINLT
jgi:hypothetical protein